MSDLVVIAFDDEATGFELRSELVKMQTEYLIQLEDAVVVTRPSAEDIQLHQAVNLTAAGAVGGGGAPGLELPGWAVALPTAYAAALRTGEPSVVARVERGRCLVDLRCVDPADDERVAAAIRAVRPTSGA